MSNSAIDLSPPPPIFNPADWYWAVGGDGTKVYSSKRNTYVGLADPAYQEWQFLHGTATANKIPSEADIWFYMKDSLPSWLLDPSTRDFTQPSTGQYTKPQLVRYANIKRMEASARGTVINMIPVSTDTVGIQELFLASLLPVEPTYWIGSDGISYALVAGAFDAIKTGVADHFKSVLDIFLLVENGINAGTITGPPQIDAAFA